MIMAVVYMHAIYSVVVYCFKRYTFDLHYLIHNSGTVLWKNAENEETQQESLNKTG